MSPTLSTNLKLEKPPDIIARAYVTAVHQYFVKSVLGAVPNPHANTEDRNALVSPAYADPHACTAGARSWYHRYRVRRRGLPACRPAASASVIQAIPDGATVDLLQVTNRQTGNSLFGYVALAEMLLALAILTPLIGGKRYYLWWYCQRA